MFGKFSEEVQKILVLANKEMSDLKHPYVGSEHLFLAIIRQDKDIASKLKKYKITYKSFKEELINVVGVGSEKSKWYLYTPLLKRILENVIIDSKETGEEINTTSIFLYLLSEGDGVAIRILANLGVDINKLYSEINSRKKKCKKNKKLSIEELSSNLSLMAKNNELDPVIGRDEEVNRLIEILSRRCKNNPLLIGDAGVGKTAIVEELARRINDGNVPISLHNKKIFTLDMASAVAGTKYRGEFEDRLKKIVKELEENEDIIVFIDEIHTLVGAGGAEGAIDASNILKPALARGKIKLIGATTISEYKKFIEKDNALDRRFQKIYVEEPNKENLKNILMKLKPIYESYHSVCISDEVIDKIIYLSSKYIYDRFEPDRSIDILDEVCTKVSLKEDEDEKELINLNNSLEKIKKEKNNCIINQKYDRAYMLKEKEENINSKINAIELKLIRRKQVKKVKVDDVISIINSKTKIPIYELNNDYDIQIKNIENKLKKNVFGQDTAVKKLCDITKKIKLGIKENNKSYSIMFCGETGCGKTYLSTLFAETLVGKKNVIKLDMSEYSDPTSINKLIGSPAGYVGYDDNKNIFEEIRNKPYSVLILDEIEKCHKSVLNFFLNILDEGKCKDSNGRVIRFDNVVIIMTSNAHISKKMVGFNDNIDNNSLDEYFSKEFLNRIDEIVSFNKFERDDILKIINKQISIYKNRYNYNINLSDEEINYIIETSKYEEYGVRKLCKLIKTNIENNLISSILG